MATRQLISNNLEIFLKQTPNTKTVKTEIETIATPWKTFDRTVAPAIIPIRNGLNLILLSDDSSNKDKVVIERAKAKNWLGELSIVILIPPPQIGYEDAVIETKVNKYVLLGDDEERLIIDQIRLVIATVKITGAIRVEDRKISILDARSTIPIHA